MKFYSGSLTSAATDIPTSATEQVVFTLPGYWKEPVYISCVGGPSTLRLVTLYLTVLLGFAKGVRTKCDVTGAVSYTYAGEYRKRGERKDGTPCLGTTGEQKRSVDTPEEIRTSCSGNPAERGMHRGGGQYISARRETCAWRVSVPQAAYCFTVKMNWQRERVERNPPLGIHLSDGRTDGEKSLKKNNWRVFLQQPPLSGVAQKQRLLRANVAIALDMEDAAHSANANANRRRPAAEASSPHSR
ncbi:unnamed protein product, partial [Rangifer tarandus platyrhynchus]